MEELPYWETINRYLERLEPENLLEVIHCLCRRLLRSRAFEDMRIRGKYWQVIIDGTQLYSTQRELDGKGLHRTHNRGTEKEYQENYYYVLEAKLVLHRKILIEKQKEEKQGIGILLFKIWIDCQLSIKNRIPFALGG